MWGRAEGDPYDDETPEPTPTRLRSRIGASLIIVALLGATARGGWLVFAGPTPIRGPFSEPNNGPTSGSLSGSLSRSSVSDSSGSISGQGGLQPLPSVSFVVHCRLSHEASDDPIFLPGQAGRSHRHSFFGNTTTDALSTVGSLLARPTSCDDLADTAAYWLPTPVDARWTAIRAYYGAGDLDPALLNVYPPGFSMISAMLGESHAAMWSCGRSIDEPGWTISVPTCPGGTSLAARIVFGQCAASQHEGLADVVFATDGSCPPTHPIGMAQLRIRAELSGTPTALSSGPLSTLHADFLNAWDQTTLARLQSICIQGNRTVQQIKLCALPGTGPRVTGFG